MYVLVLYDPKAEEKKLLKSKAKCNRWGEWIRKTQCQICGNGSRQVQRYCYNYNKSGKIKHILFKQLTWGPYSR